MLVRKIDNQPFAGKFRLPVNHIVYTRHGEKVWKKRLHCVKEFSNPNAQELYNQARKAKDINEMTRLYNEMGDYELKEMTIIERIKSLFEIGV